MENSNFNIKSIIKIELLLNQEILDVRTYNVCKINKLNSLQKIYLYYLKNKSFLALKNIGNKSNYKLLNLCSEYENNNIDIKHQEQPENQLNIDTDIDKLLLKEIFNRRSYNKSFARQKKINPYYS